MLAGFPIVAGPILLFLTLEQGPGFAAQAAISTLYGLLSLTGYCLCFCWLALGLRWWWSLLLGWGAFLLLAMLLREFPAQLSVAAMLSLLVISLAPRAFPVLVTDHAPQPVPRTELFWRVLAAAALLLGLTAVAAALGPSWSGLLTPFPVAGSVLGVFALRAGGAAQATALLRGMVNGLYSLWAFFVVAALILPILGPLALIPALLVAVLVQAVLLLRR